MAADTLELGKLIALLEKATGDAKTQLDQISKNENSTSIAQMFQMQMKMNHLSQMSEMSTSIASACNSAIVSMARNTKG